MGVGPTDRPRPRSTCPTCSRARASCPARSTRCSPRRRSMVCAQVIGNDAAVDRRRRQRQLRAQRDDAGDGPQPARVDPAARRTPRRLLADRCVDGITADADRMRALRRVLAVGRHAAEQATSATRTPPRSPSRRWPRSTTIRETVIDAGLRRARRAHRGAARRGARRRRDDTQGLTHGVEATGRGVVPRRLTADR